MNILSLFDGIGAGRVALDRVGIKIDKYYSSEIDKYPSMIMKHNYPDTIELGDITQWKEWDIEQPDLITAGSPCTNLSFAGKQAGLSTKCNIDITTLEQYQKLQSEGFEFEGQSHLFWEFIAIRDKYKPKYFFLENVMFVKKWRDVFNEAIGFESTVINSALVSAQNRKRQYWMGTLNENGTYDEVHIAQPEDKGLVLKDIIETSSTSLSEKEMSCMLRSENPNKNVPRLNRAKSETEKSNTISASIHKGVPHGVISIVDRDKSYCIDANYYKGGNLKSYFEKHRRQLVFELNKINHRVQDVSINVDGIRPHRGDARKSGISEMGRILFEDAAKTYCLTASHVHNIEQRPCEPREFKEESTCHHAADAVDIKGNESIKRVYAETGKAPTLTTMGGGHREPKVLCGEPTVGRRLNNGVRDDYNKDIQSKQYIEINKDPNKSRCLSTVQKDTLLADKEAGRYVSEQLSYRKLTPLECERLQTFPDNYTDCVSNTRRYKAIGNSWTVDVIAHIFKGLLEEQHIEEDYLF